MAIEPVLDVFRVIEIVCEESEGVFLPITSHASTFCRPAPSFGGPLEDLKKPWHDARLHGVSDKSVFCPRVCRHSIPAHLSQPCG